ncbi:hypothetical protein [Heyndrickxia camelliae]|uniref:Uncharacterized protein n=1 Tax=Heyndrickxia camelliae TaxID=1707093 RepID=A0A2N3LEG9_9BACI|nr:hypothetical protein [Heyndrickxia camelliae]PKR83042.1 hypothetical protein CWO92_21125 [Heyndrickxia camelliae]
MFLILFKRVIGADDFQIELEKPLKFTVANQSLNEFAQKYKTTGKIIKIKYRILDAVNGDTLFNSNITINQEFDNLYSEIKNNASAPKSVVDFIYKIENGEILEKEIFSIEEKDREQKGELEKLEIEKRSILQNIKAQEKESQLREEEFQKTMDALHQEMIDIEQKLALKEKEEKAKEKERLERLSELENKKKKAEEIAEQKREEDKRKKEQHEARLKELEEAANEATYQLELIRRELKKKEAERQAELTELEEKRKEAERQAQLLKVEDSKNEILYKTKKIDLQKKRDVEANIISEVNVSPELPNLEGSATLDKRKLHLENVTSGMIRFAKLIRNHINSNLEAKRERQNIKLQIEKAKIDFIAELQKDKLEQEKMLNKERIKREKEKAALARKEKRFRKEMQQYKFHNKKLSVFKRLIILCLIIIASKYMYDSYSPFTELVNHIWSVIVDSKSKYFN